MDQARTKQKSRRFQDLGDCGEQPSKPKMLLIDDDPVFLAIMKRWADLENVELESYASLEEVGYIGLLANYDIAVIDYDLGKTTGIDIATCTDVLLNKLPIIIVSGKDRSEECRQAPSCVKAVLNKSGGYSSIFHEAKRLVNIHPELRDQPRWWSQRRPGEQ